ncbi:hypothetical protein, partial [Leifsonia xyli]|uniref:hypothetical protein n=1 Tax=Leifsonia xyli TaxID=1575 RepID=UPI001C3FFCA9
ITSTTPPSEPHPLAESTTTSLDITPRGKHPSFPQPAVGIALPRRLFLAKCEAASVSVSAAVVLISVDGGYSWARYDGRKGATCYNLGTQRNRNTNWMVRAA